MGNIRPAEKRDVSRIAEIFVFNYRLNFYPFFKNDPFYFCELNVLDTAAEFAADLSGFYVYDDGIVKGFISVIGDELNKLHVDPQFQSQGIGAELLAYATDELGVTWLWALEQNVRGQAFYRRHGFELTGEKLIEDEWVPLLKMALGKDK
ncbi:MAG: GNAT family N-acetyltransferase [Ruminococcus sp.]|nr:GNAT family N-acetyltransferase [Ruminococcus sp.]